MTKQKILIAEDELHLREILRYQLEAAGFEVIDAHDGRQALEKVTAHMPDLVLLDVMMPFMNGYEVCSRLRESYATRHIPIIMLTAKSESTDRIHGLQGGANDYVTKPWEARELMLRVRNMLDWSREQREASPLTGLPGNLAINDEIERRLLQGTPFAVLQFDIDYFKSFNDFYGFARGDDAIRALAAVLVEVAYRHDGETSFVGHIGGDDFVALTTPEHAELIGREVIDAFDAAAGALYDPEDRKRGYVKVPNRLHKMDRFPIMSLTVVMVCTDEHPVEHLAQLTDIAQELKKLGKQRRGSVLIGERRRTSGRGPAANDRSAA